MKRDIEFHYIVSYHEQNGWSVLVNDTNRLFPQGFIYRWDPNSGGEWIKPYDDTELSYLDQKHLRDLTDALNNMNGDK
jgi:hypothetical protein